MTQPSTPNAQDLVLGGQFPPPFSGAVLGGLAGLEHRFNQADITQKLAALAEAATYGESALPLIQRGLQDDNLQVRMAAYLPLKSLKPNDLELKRGLPLRVGDRIYAVYESSVSFGDDLYYIRAQIDEEEDEDYLEEYPLYHSSQDSDGHAFEYISDAPEDNQRDPCDEGYDPSLIAYYVDPSAAAVKAQIVYEEKFGNLGCEIYELDSYIEADEDDLEEDDEDFDAGGISQSNTPAGFNLKAWVAANQVVVDAKIPKNWGDEDWAYEFQVLMSLQNQKQFSLLRELWQQKRYRPLAFVHEYVIDRPYYLRLTALET
ncbi:MAG: hypothetical protein KME45_22410 [Stenomitos rutilans HA7619-LM2]|jgi:hypothetical protein|nr:hypothetical protein [Stenomitos rutilans HA7619-LM2]